MLDPVKTLPFVMGSESAQKARQSVENHLAQQQVQKNHSRAHRAAKAIEQAQLELLKSYDKSGKQIELIKEQGSKVDIKI